MFETIILAIWACFAVGVIFYQDFKLRQVQNDLRQYQEKYSYTQGL